jgi:tRNA(Ile)-lysidine synthase
MQQLWFYQQVARQEEENIKFDIKQVKITKLQIVFVPVVEWIYLRPGKTSYDLVESQLKTSFLKAEYQLLKDRDFLIVAPLDFEKKNGVL